MTAYYNEIDPQAAAWLRELIKRGLIAAGEVDERSIEDVAPDDLAGFRQCHFFAGIGGWSLALRLAGWPDDRPVWTGSCPCQPFSAAGKGDGFTDERHLWPAFHWLIKQCRPSVVFGEQVASKHADAWVDLVCADLEALGYAFGAVPFPAAGIGAPHIRDRLYWMADANGERGAARVSAQARGYERLAGIADDGCGEHAGAGFGREIGGAEPVRLADSGLPISEQLARPRARPGQETGARAPSQFDGCRELASGMREPGPTNGHWRAADWLACRDGKWRPVSASPQPLVDGVFESLGRVRDSHIQAIEEEVNAWEMETGFGRSEGLRDLWLAAYEAAPRIWQAGRIPGLHEAAFLLAFMRQLAQQGWGVAECLSVPSSQVHQGRMRVLWSDVGATCPPHQLRLEGQPAREYPDALRVLSSILARHAHQAWEVAHAAYAETCFPLVHGARGRVQRLRGYGNAIVPQAAAAFVRAFL